MAGTNLDSTAMQTIAEKQLKNAWFRVFWSGALLLLFGSSVTSRLEAAQRNDQTTAFGVITLLVLVRFGYYVWRLIQARKQVAQMKRMSGQTA